MVVPFRVWWLGGGFVLFWRWSLSVGGLVQPLVFVSTVSIASRGLLLSCCLMGRVESYVVVQYVMLDFTRDALLTLSSMTINKRMHQAPGAPRQEYGCT
jgi:hypothetical protein